MWFDLVFGELLLLLHSGFDWPYSGQFSNIATSWFLTDWLHKGNVTDLIFTDEEGTASEKNIPTHICLLQTWKSYSWSLEDGAVFFFNQEISPF